MGTFSKGCCSQNHGARCTPVRHLRAVPVPVRDSGEWNLHPREDAGPARGPGRAPCGDRETRSGRVGDLQCLNLVDRESAFANWVATRTSHGLMGVVLLALFSLNNSNSPNSQGNPLH